MTIQQTIGQFDRLRHESVEWFARCIAAIVHAVPPEYADIVENIGKEFAERQEALPGEMEQVTAQIKAHVLATGELLVGQSFQASIAKGRTTWDGDKLTALALTYPEIATCKKTGEPQVRIGALTVRKKFKPGVMFDEHIG